MEVCDCNSLAATLATKRSAGVTQEVNLRNLLLQAAKHVSEGIHPNLCPPKKCLLFESLKGQFTLNDSDE